MDKLRRIIVISHNPANSGSSYKDVFWPFKVEKITYSRLVSEVQFGMGTHDDIAITTGNKLPHQGRAGQPAVACDVNAGAKRHGAVTGDWLLVIGVQDQWFVVRGS